MKSIFLFYLLCVFYLCSLSNSAPIEDLVNLSSIQSEYKIDYKYPVYSGFLQSTLNVKLHYVFLPSQNNPSDPLLLWLNGGPGCSSMLGFMLLNGGFNFKPFSKEIEINKYSWNKFSNILYLESPAGVGFSVGSPYNHSDDEVANENLVALNSFFIKFPEYRKNDFYITGESYAGTYIPILANTILNFNKSSILKINLKGMMIGNGMTHPDFDFDSALIEFFYGHGFYSIEMKKEVDENCGIIPPFKVNDESCKVLVNKIKELTKDLYLEDIYRECSPPEGFSLSNSDKETNIKILRRKHWIHYKNSNFNENSLSSSGECGEDYKLEEFFNNPKVQNAFHMPNIKYEECSNTVKNSYNFSGKYSFYVYKTLINSKIRILNYHGDTDGYVPFTGARLWIKSLNLPVIDPFRPWYANGSKEIAGFITKYDGLTFATVKDGGHEVPQNKRKETFYLISSFLNGSDI